MVVLKHVARVLLVLVFLAMIPLSLHGINSYSNYKSWRALSPALISDASQWYIPNRASEIGDVTAICVYALDCSGDRARLAIVQNVDEYDFEALKQRIWARRFEGTCSGQTANLGLHLLRSQDSGKYDYSDHAIWSFNNNRFIPMQGHWSGGAFSEEPWERCSTDGATFMVQKGVALKIAH